MTSIADRPDSDDAQGAEHVETQEQEPDTTRLGFRDTEEERAYDDHEEQAQAQTDDQ